MEVTASPKSVRISNKFLAAEAEQAANAGNVLTCKQCNKRVYEMEKIIADSSVYHKTCFKCCHCKRVLSLGNYTAAGGNKQLYCKPHFIELFRTKGNYEEGFGMEKKTRPPGCDTFEGLQPNAGQSTPPQAKQKSPSKWDKPANQPEISNRRDDMDGAPSDLPAPSTTRDMLARYTNAAGGDGQGSGPRAQEPVTSAELPEQGTTKMLLAKFKEIQANGGEAKSPAAPKQPIKLVDDEGADDGRAPPPPRGAMSPRSPQPARITPEGGVSPIFEHHQQAPASISSPVTSPRANGAPALHSGSDGRSSQYDNEEEDEEEEASRDHEDAGGLLVAVKNDAGSKVDHDISDEDEVERDIESHHHEGHHEVGQGHYEGHEEVGHANADYEEEESESHGGVYHQQEEEEQGYRDEQSAEEHHGRAEEGQLIDFNDEQDQGRRPVEGGEEHERQGVPQSPGRGGTVNQHHGDAAANESEDDDDYLEDGTAKMKTSRKQEEEEE